MRVADVLNLQGNELQNANLQNLAAAPSSPGLGRIYLDTSTSPAVAYICVNPTGPVWARVTLGTNGVTSADIADSTIVNGDISPSAAIALSKLATDPLARANHTGTQVAATISDFAATVQANRLDQLAVPQAALNLNNQTINNVPDPTTSQQVANKNYVDLARQGIRLKDAVRAASTTNLTLSGLQTVDGVVLGAGDRVLVKNQITTNQNGIYIVASGAWTRAGDADAAAELNDGATTFVQQGTLFADTTWTQTASVVTLNTDPVTWTQQGSTVAYVGGAGLLLTGTTFDIGAGTGIQVNTDSIQISPTYVGQTSITTLGTIAAGTWQATAIGVAYGGTGATTAAAARTNLGAARAGLSFQSSAGPSTPCPHNFNTNDVQVHVYENTPPYETVYTRIERTDTNTVTVRFSPNATASQYTILVTPLS